MHAPQIMMIALYALGTGTTLAKHGSPETGSHNVFVTIAATALSAGILWWGGFWG